MIRIAAIALVLSMSHIAPARSAPLSGTLQASERPQLTTTRPPYSAATYGLCSAPQNADAFPSGPVPVETTRCEFIQRFSATSAAPSSGASCGGYTVAFGPMGDLKRAMKSVTLSAGWGDAPLTAATCPGARLAAVAWGYRCDNEACSAGAWERIGSPRSVPGSWNGNTQSCSMPLSLGGAGHSYSTVNIDVIASLIQNGSPVRKRAKATIEARRGNGQCFSASAPQR